MIRSSAIVAALLVTTGLCAGCFNTKDVKSGGLQCAPDKSCPDGLFCGEGNLCYRNGTQGVNVCTKTEAQLPFGPFTACSSAATASALCDPVCQTGCSCTHRCQMAGDASSGYIFECQAPPEGTLLDTFQACDPSHDLCRPGQTCLQPPKDSTGCAAQCYRYCRANSDCPTNSYCVFPIDLGGQKTVSVCSPPAVVCEPAQTSTAQACSSSPTGTSCYVFSNDFPDQTMCDCAGTIPAGAPCTDLHSCVPGYECVAKKCQKTCLLVTGGAVACGSGLTCVPLFGTSSKFGTCQ
jgi:hypothetical protein